MLAGIYERRNIRSLWRQVWDFFLVGSACGADIVVEGAVGTNVIVCISHATEIGTLDIVALVSIRPWISSQLQSATIPLESLVS
jgi:hypothetical protein